jgi:hypothetical protein
MSDYLKHKIEETQVLLDAKLQDVATLRGQLQAYEDALAHEIGGASARNIAPPQSGGAQGTKRDTPPPRSPATAYWSKLIDSLGRHGDRFTIDDVMGELKRLGKKLERKSVRAKLTDFVKERVLIRIEDGVFQMAPRGISGDELRATGIIPPHARLIGEDAA